MLCCWEWVHRWACLFCCAGFLLLSISQGLRGTQGKGGGHMTGPCKAELVTPIVPQQIHLFWRPSVSSLSAHSSARYSRHGGEPDVPLPDRQRLQIPNISELPTAEQVHVLPQGQNGHFCTPFSAKLCADITIYRPLAHPMFGSLFNIYMAVQ